MKSKASTVKEYVDGLPAERRPAIQAVLRTIRKNLPAGYEERLTWGMPCWQVPLRVFPDTYNGQPLMYAALASQKNHMAVYLVNVYGSPVLRKELEAGFKAAGKKLDMGKSCIRFKKVEDLALEVIATAFKRMPVKKWIEVYETCLKGMRRKGAERSGKKAGKKGKTKRAT
jgi:uncharacterized protein YdhG (YjbR/CyaY superfamily)